MRTFGRILTGTRGRSERVWIIRDVEPHVSMRLKAIFSKIRKADSYQFVLPITRDAAADLEWFMQRYPLVGSDATLTELEAMAEEHRDRVSEVEQIFADGWQPPADPPGLRDGQELRPYQQQFLAMFALSQRMLLGDDIGLGKTYEGIGACLQPGALPAAIVVQTHLPKQWARKVEEFSTLRTHQITVTRPYELPEADVYIFRYSQLVGWVDYFRTAGFRIAVFDEIQELRRGSQSMKGMAAKTLCQHVDRALGLTATPVYNYGIEMFNIAEILRPGMLGSQGEFVREWAGGDPRVVVAPEALGTYLREQQFLLRRTKGDVGQQIDNVNTIVETVDYSRAEAQKIDELARDLALRSLTASFVERGQAARELDIRVRQATGIAKAKHVAAFVRVLLEGGNPVLLAGWHREVYSIWLNELRKYRPALYTGTESGKQKDAAIEAFKCGETDLLVMSLRSGAGVDGLQHRCSTVVIGELDWSPKVHEQLIGRVDREGQGEPVMAIYLVSDNGSDPPMVDLLGLKQSQGDGIMDPGRELKARPSDDSRLRALALSLLSPEQRAEVEAMEREARSQREAG